MKLQRSVLVIKTMCHNKELQKLSQCERSIVLWDRILNLHSWVQFINVWHTMLISLDFIFIEFSAVSLTFCPGYKSQTIWLLRAIIPSPCELNAKILRRLESIKPIHPKVNRQLQNIKRNNPNRNGSSRFINAFSTLGKIVARAIARKPNEIAF